MILAAVLCAACEPTLVAEFTDKPVVSCYLQAGESPVLTVQKLIPFQDDAQFSDEDVTSQTTVPSAPQGVTFSGYSIGVMSFDFPESSKAPNNGIEITWNLFGWAIALNSKIKSTFGA